MSVFLFLVGLPLNQTTTPNSTGKEAHSIMVKYLGSHINEKQ